ncbi:hypothetical protein HY416_03250 [Candidatus Kaiserbacteria bacterium]|nr:hypothetical protein [Candidatus Kaiserbacteria bacterium]
MSTPESTAKGGSKDVLSRREFLKTAVSGAGATVFFTMEGRHVWAAEVKEGMSWIEGIRALRSIVFKPGAVEESAIFIKGKYGAGRWSVPQEGKQGNVDIVYEDLGEVAEMVRKNELEEIMIAHVHVLDGVSRGYTMTKEIESQMQVGTQTRLVLPPSYHDVAIARARMPRVDGEGLEEIPRRLLKEVVVDPRGVWIYQHETDPNGAFTKGYAEALALAERFAPEMEALLENFTKSELLAFLDLKRYRGGSLGTADPGDTLSHIRIKAQVAATYALRSNNLSWIDLEDSAPLQRCLASASEATRRAYDDYIVSLKEYRTKVHNLYDSQETFIQKSAENTVTSEDYIALKRAYYEVSGVAIDFVSYDDIGL